MTPPDLLRPGPRGLSRLLGARPLVRAGWAPARPRPSRCSPGPRGPILDRWFESVELKATLATDAIIGAMASPSMPGTAYVLFHHVMGETDGKRGVWGYVRGGMGGLTQALARAARGPRRRDPLRAPVARIRVRDGRVTGVALDERRRVPRAGSWRATPTPT